MPPLVIKPLVIKDALYSLDEVTIRQIVLSFNSLRKNDVEPHVELTLKVIERTRVICY